MLNFCQRGLNRALIAISINAVCILNAQAAYPENPYYARPILSSSIIGVRDYEIFQRELPQNTSNISVRIEDTKAVSGLAYYSISSLTDNGVRQSILTEGRYQGTRMLSFNMGPQNSFKRVRISFYDTQGIERKRWDSPYFNVGEIFIVAGQSNVANHGDTEGNDNLFKADNLHRAIDPRNGGKWLPLEGAMPFATSWDYPRNGSPWASFADKLGVALATPYKNQGLRAVPIAVVNVAYGGSAVQAWDPKATKDSYGNPVVLFDRLRLAAKSLQRYTANEGNYKCGFRAVLWHQGESNSNSDFAKDNKDDTQEPSRKWYARQLFNIAQSFNQTTSCNQPWMVASASWIAPHWRADANLNVATKFDVEQEVREGQRYLSRRERLSAQDPVFVEGPDTDLLSGDDPATGGRKAYRSDGVHFNAQGLVLHGQLWANRVAHMIDPKSNAFVDEKDIIPEVKRVWTLYKTELNRKDSDIYLDYEGVRYWTQTLTLNPNIDLRSMLLQSSERYVRDVFATQLNRAPTLWEVNYWTKELNDGRVTTANLYNTSNVGFENTLSPTGKRAYLMYAQIMGRTPPQVMADLQGLRYWTTLLDRGVDEERVRSAFLASNEYAVRYAFVTTKGRQPTNAELETFSPMVNPTVSQAALSKLVWEKTGK